MEQSGHRTINQTNIAFCWIWTSITSHTGIHGPLPPSAVWCLQMCRGGFGWPSLKIYITDFQAAIGIFINQALQQVILRWQGHLRPNNRTMLVHESNDWSHLHFPFSQGSLLCLSCVYIYMISSSHHLPLSHPEPHWPEPTWRAWCAPARSVHGARCAWKRSTDGPTGPGRYRSDAGGES